MATLYVSVFIFRAAEKKNRAEVINCQHEVSQDLKKRCRHHIITYGSVMDVKYGSIEWNSIGESDKKKKLPDNMARYFKPDPPA